MTLDVRAAFPALAEGLAHLDGPGGTQVPAVVADASRDLLRTAVSNRHGPFPSSARADALVDAAREAVADLVGGESGGVVFSQSMTAGTYVLADALAKTWSPGDEVVVSRLDHDANVRPWVQAAERAGAAVRWAEVEPRTCELPTEQYERLLTERTRLVALTAASNAVGTRPDVAEIARRAHEVGALVHVDGVAATPHAAVDAPALGADVWATSAYKWYGPHLGAHVAAPDLLDRLRPDKLLPSSDDVPDRFERGTPSFVSLAMLVAAVDWIASLGDGATRRDRVLAGMRRVEEHESRLLQRLLDGLGSHPRVTVLGEPADRAPVVAFTVDGESPQAFAARAGAAGVCVWAGHYYAIELMTALGLPDGAVRAGLSAYSNEDDVDRLLALL